MGTLYEVAQKVSSFGNLCQNGRRLSHDLLTQVVILKHVYFSLLIIRKRSS